MEDFIQTRVHQLYWESDINCARTSLICLGELFHVHIDTQAINAAIGLHGAGGLRAQCGLVEGPLMFIGIFFSMKEKNEAEIVEICYQYANEFRNKFGSLSCYDLRPNGFSKEDPPHACERLTADAITFAYHYINAIR